MLILLLLPWNWHLLGRLCGRGRSLSRAAAKRAGSAGRAQVRLRHDAGPSQVRGACHSPPKPLAGRLAIGPGEGKYGQTAEGALNALSANSFDLSQYLDQIADKEYGADVLYGLGGKAQIQGLHLGGVRYGPVSIINHISYL